MDNHIYLVISKIMMFHMKHPLKNGVRRMDGIFQLIA